MSTDSLELIKRTVADLDGGQTEVSSAPAPRGPLSPLMQGLMGICKDAPVDLNKLQSALEFLDPAAPRGNGSFYDGSGRPKEDYWLAAIWALNSTGHPAAKKIAKEWSQKAPDRYTEEGFELAWDSYDPHHAHPIGVGSLFKYATERGWQHPAPPQPTARRYKLLTGKDLAALPPIDWRLKGIFPGKGLASIYGPSRAGKSFIALDLGVAIAEGAVWFGHRTKKSTVVYVALEGQSGYKNRGAAWELDNGRSLPEDLLMVMQPFHLTTPEDVDELAAVVPTGSVVMVDTLNRAAPTSDENSSKEMGEILEACKRLQGLIDGLVVLIHHSGKDTARGARGHSSFFAALDGAIEVERTVTQRSWSVAKSKDGQDGNKTLFELKHHVLGTDADGDEITSCTIAPALGNIFAKPQPKGQRQQAALRTLEQHFKALTAPNTDMPGGPLTDAQVRLEEAVALVVETLVAKPPNKRNHEARRLLQALADGGFIGLTLGEGQETWCRLL
ncbi:MAG: AAA family ATPase [Proteobacteria bacterium]|nr:AAA family ATPase [Pseudomonadota bacterium]